MNLLPTTEQAEIVSVIGEFLSSEVPIRRYQETINLGTPYPAALWQQFVKLGWFGVSCPEHLGGSGLGIAEEILLAREAGRQLISPTVLATAFTANLASRHDQAGLANSLINGEKRVAIALATKEDNYLMFDGDDADYLLTCHDNKINLFPAAAIAKAETLKGTDESVSLTRATLTGTPLLKNIGESDVMRLAIGLCAVLTGIAESACAAAVSYAGEREQFGQPIGAFQAIKHLCADMAVRNEAAWSQCVYAALSLQDQHEDATRQIAAAMEMSTRAALENARTNIQVHGGVGFTVEYDAHLLVKRTHVLSSLLDSLIDRRKMLLTQ
jgi:alkylation response protein AidB-like acyl-CoA dehydrogenase